MTTNQGRSSAAAAGAPLFAWHDSLGGASVQAAFTWRHGGVSDAPYDSFNLGDHVGDATADVLTNRELLAGAVGVRTSRLVFMQQVHGAEVAVVDEDLLDQHELPLGPVAGVDGLVTALPGVALVVLVADCVPVLLADPVAGVLGVAHAGRRGVMTEVAAAVVERMRSLGARRFHAVVGPSVCGRCYEVPEQLQREVATGVPSAEVAVETRMGTPGLDLPAAVVAQLVQAGVTEVVTAPLGPGHGTPCTVEDPAYFSYRRDGVTGRFGGVVWRQ